MLSPPSEVEHFSPARVSEKVLFHLLRHPSVNQEVHFDHNNRLSSSHYLYTRNHPVDYFILLLQVRSGSSARLWGPNCKKSGHHHLKAPLTSSGSEQSTLGHVFLGPLMFADTLSQPYVPGSPTPNLHPLLCFYKMVIESCG